MQMGEIEHNIYIIGSPDIDIMLSERLPSIEQVRERYKIDYDSYAILMYHPVTTEYDLLADHIHEVVDAVIASEKNYIVVYPNNDFGYQLILNEYKRFEENKHFRMYPSLKFEYFLSLLKKADFIIGNSSAGIREASVYGVPDIDIGTRQSGRYSLNISRNIQHVGENCSEILKAVSLINEYRIFGNEFGNGNSSEQFMQLINNDCFWGTKLQKKFIDFNM